MSDSACNVSRGHYFLPEGLAGFNGECREPLTGHYLLGNGYRVFNPVLMRFNSPDGSSPFGRGGLNAYAYCHADPVNLTDPDGRMPRPRSMRLRDSVVKKFTIQGMTQLPELTDEDLLRGGLYELSGNPPTRSKAPSLLPASPSRAGATSRLADPQAMASTSTTVQVSGPTMTSILMKRMNARARRERYKENMQLYDRVRISLKRAAKRAELHRNQRMANRRFKSLLQYQKDVRTIDQLNLSVPDLNYRSISNAQRITNADHAVADYHRLYVHRFKADPPDEVWNLV